MHLLLTPLWLLLVFFTCILNSYGVSADVEHLDPTLPPALPAAHPTCTIVILQQDFADTVGSPPAASNFSPTSNCPAPWTGVVLELSVSISDVQKDRVAAIWVDGAEILRTSTPLSIVPGTFWKVHKDVTRYASLLRRPPGNDVVVSMMLENSNTDLPGVFSANVSLHFYRGLLGARFGHMSRVATKGLYHEPADLIIPISQSDGGYRSGFWFRIENQSHVPVNSFAVPKNTHRAILEIFASQHGNDELWYTKPLRSSYSDQQGNEHSTSRSNGGFRRLYATIDGQFVGGHVPFPVIYSGSINPYFWSPVAAISAFNMPSYDLDITPFLALLLDEQPHVIGLGVRDAQSYWLVDANLHLWLDAFSNTVEAGLVEYHAPELTLTKQAEWRDDVDGGSDIDAEGLVRFVGWAVSSKGNITTTVRQKTTFRSQVEVQNRGAVKRAEMTHKERTTVNTVRGRDILGRVRVFRESPLQLQTEAEMVTGGVVVERSRLYHGLEEVVELNEDGVVSSSALVDRQDAEGSAVVVASDGDQGVALWGSGSTRSSYKYRAGSMCYFRAVEAAGGVVKSDDHSASCAAAEI